MPSDVDVAVAVTDRACSLPHSAIWAMRVSVSFFFLLSFCRGCNILHLGTPNTFALSNKIKVIPFNSNFEWEAILDFYIYIYRCITYTYNINAETYTFICVLDRLYTTPANIFHLRQYEKKKQSIFMLFSLFVFINNFIRTEFSFLFLFSSMNSVWFEYPGMAWIKYINAHRLSHILCSVPIFAFRISLGWDKWDESIIEDALTRFKCCQFSLPTFSVFNPNFCHFIL